ncbi:hypothetical protein SUDANB171_03954 [Streptomyces sp. enrichment culture]|uniref:hypothetical protein n=1 Tax=Streptomyces sp. enrichment culture TaxID=1795815 RepID=UPI003F54E646
MSQYQPGPYGQQPPQGQPGQPGPYGAPPPPGPPGGAPNPYAQGGAPGAPSGPGYGYPQQQPGQPGPPPPPGAYPGQPGQPGQPQGAPYGQPQAPGPYGQQPPQGPPGQYPGQPPYGQVPPPPSGGGNGKKAGIIVGALAVVAALAVGGVVLLGGDDEKNETLIGYTLSFPEQSGEFQRQAIEESTDMSEEELAQFGLGPDAQGATASYLAGIDIAELEAMTDPTELGGTVLTSMVGVGLWGDVDNPEASVDAMLAYAAEQAANGEGGQLLDSPQSVSPSGLNGATMKCQYAEVDDATLGEAAQVPLCVWADNSTMGFAAFQKQQGVQSGLEMSIDEAANATAQLRSDSLTAPSGS